MPTNTFINLATEKRERVLDAALEELARHSFHQATVTGIVERAGIPKGSFYQYFESKKDLYRYLVSITQDKKLEYMRSVLEEVADANVFAKLRELYRAGIAFAKDNPRLLAIGQNLIKEDEELKQDTFDRALPEAQVFLENLLEQGVQSGEIDADADLEVAASLITSYNLTLMDLILNLPSGEGVDRYLSKIDEMIYILRYGLGKK